MQLEFNSSVLSNICLQVWLCGGSMEVLPCSRVAHIARMKKPYHSNIAFHTRRNALRVAEVWMDEYKSNVYLAWNIPMEVRGGNSSYRCDVAYPGYKADVMLKSLYVPLILLFTCIE